MNPLALVHCPHFWKKLPGMKLLLLATIVGVGTMTVIGETANKGKRIGEVTTATTNKNPTTVHSDHNLRTSRNTQTDCSKKAIRIYRFCIDGDHEENYPNELDYGEYRFEVDGLQYYPIEEGDCFQGSDPGLTTDPKTEGHCSWKSNLCHDFEYKDSSRTGWISHESHRSIVVTLYEEDHHAFSKDDVETVTLSPNEWHNADMCDTYEIRLAREFKPEKDHSVCWSLSAGGGIGDVALEAGVEYCTTWTSPPESWTYLMEVKPLSAVVDERDDLKGREEGNSGCFSALDTVLVESCTTKGTTSSMGSTISTDSSTTDIMARGENMYIRDVKVGDRVLTANENGDLSFSPVVYIPHGPNEVRATFLQIVTEGGNKALNATKMHLLRMCDRDTIRAKDLKVGDCLLTVDGQEFIETINLRTSVAGGIYTLVTENEYLVVGGIVASPFAYFHKPVHYFYYIHRMVYRYSSVIRSILLPIMEDVINLAPLSTVETKL